MLFPLYVLVSGQLQYEYITCLSTVNGFLIRNMTENPYVGILFENVNFETMAVIVRGNRRLLQPGGRDPVVPLKTRTDSQENRLSTLYFQILTPMPVENSLERV